MIRDLEVSRDAAGFPVITWTEKRNLASPEPMRRARVECRIMKDPTTGALLFVTRGTVRHGSFEEGKPWRMLHGFSKRSADELYYTRQEIDLRHYVTNKGIGAKLALGDSAHVILAEFESDTALHINCADAPVFEIEKLHVQLVREFLSSRDVLVGNLCRGVEFEWPLGDDRVMTYDPARAGRRHQQKPGLIMEALGWIAALGLVVALGGFVLWQLGGFR